MKINRREVIKKHNPVLKEADITSPLTVGNGNFAFTVDVTGLQTLYQEYESELPLCTMSVSGWHTKPAKNERGYYTLEDLVMTEYKRNGKTYRYPKKKMPGNEEVYDWLRMNPHRLNLAKVAFVYEKKEISSQDLSEIHQELDLYEGILKSEFILNHELCSVQTAVDPDNDTIAVQIKSKLLKEGLSILLDFPYGSPSKSASDWENTACHTTKIIRQEKQTIVLQRQLDFDSYMVILTSDKAIDAEQNGHKIYVRFADEEATITVQFCKTEKERSQKDCRQILKDSARYFEDFWEKGGFISFEGSTDDRAMELERRIILSLYLMTVNCCGSTPPQETGLTCNSWYGKMHLEMYFWHLAWTTLWNHTELLERSLSWFEDHIKAARENAARNGYTGARWPKMIANEGIDAPSPVAPLLIWQQPHLIFMIYLAYRSNNNSDLIKRYWNLIEESAEFMVDFVVYNEKTKSYDLNPPLIPAQECHKPEVSKNPVYENEYFAYALSLTATMADTIGVSCNPKYREIALSMADLAQKNGLYLAHENCLDTFENYHRDHPSMLCAYGVLPGARADKTVMKNTLKKVMECWDYETLWGWDFAVMAMTAVRLDIPEMALDLLLMDSPKNCYVTSGNNRQNLRKDLPLYLPGNGSLLLAIPIMAAGYDGCQKELPGFLKDGSWQVQYENISRYV